MVRVVVEVVEVRGYCALNYERGDKFVLKDYYIESMDKPICIHAFTSMLTFITLMLKGYSAKKLGIGEKDDIGYIQCPDPGKPYTDGGTVIFKITRLEE